MKGDEDVGTETVIIEDEAVDEVSAMLERVKEQATARATPPQPRKARPAKRKKRRAVEKARRKNRR